MIEQRVENQTARGWRGIALILAIALAVVLGSGLFEWLGRYIGRIASLLFIAYGVAIAWFLLNRYVLGFLYYLSDGCLRVYRVYGKRQRFMQDMWLNSLVACGAPEAMRQRFPQARLHRAVKPQCPLEPMALAYRDSDGDAILLIQPEPKLREALIQAVRKK